MFTRLGRIGYDRRRLVAALWAVIFITGIALAGAVTDRLTGDGMSGKLEAVEGYQELGRTSAYGTRISAVLDGPRVDSPTVQQGLKKAHTELAAMSGVGRVVDPTTDHSPFLVATDRRAAIIAVDLERDLPDTERTATEHAVEGRLRALATDIPDSKVLVGGDGLIRQQIKEQTNKDTTIGEGIALPVTLLVMVFLFGGLLAAGVPFLGALCSIGGGLLTLYGFSFVVDLDPSVLSVTSVMGLGLSIDYSLLMVSRFREERARGLDPRAAVIRTSETAGRTITYSALTVATSLAGLFVFPSTIFRAIAAAGVGVVLVALLAALTLTPALLALFAKRITGRGSLRLWRRRSPDAATSSETGPTSETGAASDVDRDPDDGFFARLARQMQRRPILVTLSVTAILAAAGLPFLGVNFTNSGPELLPKTFESRQFADLTADRFAGQDVRPVTVVARTDAATLQGWAEGLRGTPGVGQVGRAEQRAAGVSKVDILPTKSDHDRDARDLVRRLRSDDRPAFKTWVTGNAAFLVDFTDEIADYAPWALALVGLATFVLLFLMTGSVLVPIKALVMNTLSLGASFGALVVIFQKGFGASLLGFDSTGGLEVMVPVIVFAFAFGLSMDYEVFLLARVKELHDAGMPNDRAVELGLQRSGRIITSAALLVVVVFAGFAAGQMLVIKEMGVAMAIAVIVDATLVRCLLVPATMTLLGKANWWAPAPLRRFHARFGLREAPSEPMPAAAHHGATAVSIPHSRPRPADDELSTVDSPR